MHAQGISAMLAGLPYQRYIGEVTAPDPGSGLPGELEYPHLVLWPPPANRVAVTMNGYGGEATTTTQVTAVGRDVREVITALDRVSAALFRRRPTIPGRECGLIDQREDAPPPPAPDRDEQIRIGDGRPVFFSFLHFSLFSSAVAPSVVVH